MQSISNPAVLLLAHIVLMATSVAGKCVLGDGLLNSLVGQPAGVEQKDDYTAEETVLGWSSGPLIGITTNLTESELKECLQEYNKPFAVVDRKPLPPGVTPDNDPSRQPYLPTASGKDVLITGNFNGRGEYYTTYDGSKYRFKEKGYVIDPPEKPPNATPPPPVAAKPSETSEAPKPSTTPGTANPRPPNTKQPGKGSNKKSKDELKAWYKAFVSVVSKYM